MSSPRTSTPIQELVQKLLEQTRAGKVRWEDSSISFAGENFRTHVGSGMASIGKSFRGGEIDEERPRSDEGFAFAVLNSLGQTVIEFSVFEFDEPLYDPLKELFHEARMSARGGSEVIGSMLEELSR